MHAAGVGRPRTAAVTTAGAARGRHGRRGLRVRRASASGRAQRPLLGGDRVAGVLLEQGAGGGGVVLDVQALAAVGVDHPVVGPGLGQPPGLGGGAGARLLLDGLARAGGGIAYAQALAAVRRLDLVTVARGGEGEDLPRAAGAGRLGELRTVAGALPRHRGAQAAARVDQGVVAVGRSRGSGCVEGGDEPAGGEKTGGQDNRQPSTEMFLVTHVQLHSCDRGPDVGGQGMAEQRFGQCGLQAVARRLGDHVATPASSQTNNRLHYIYVT